MKIQRVYVDTSVIGGCFDDEFSIWSNGLMEDFRLGNYTPVFSEAILAEISDAPADIRKLYQSLQSLDPEIIPITESALELANSYQSKGILSPNFFADGLHIALATIAEVDLLVSWNFKHIVHFDKIRLFNAVNIELGYKPLQIYSPREVTRYEEKQP